MKKRKEKKKVGFVYYNLFFNLIRLRKVTHGEKMRERWLNCKRKRE